MNTLMCISTFRFLVISNKVICIIKYSNLLEFKVNYFLYHMCSKYFYLHFPVLPVIQNWWHEDCGCLDGVVLLDLEHPPGPSSTSWLGNLCSWNEWHELCSWVDRGRLTSVIHIWYYYVNIKGMKYLISFSNAFQIIQYMTSFCNFWYFIEVLLKIAKMCHRFWSLQSCRLIKFKLKVEWQN